MAPDSWQTAFDQLAQLKTTWPGTAWSWDGRFATVGSSFALALEPQALASASRALPRSWDIKTLAEAPDALRALATRTGGLRAQQRLFAGEQDALYGLWWPWGSGTTITLRIGITDGDTTTRLRTLFGVT
ncbi:MAG: hypothetical protein JWO36_7180 [Myxococcales bacterium]|nr:hypothetical protein [Myxococcales bacterium]